ncbi:MAG: WxcM-like domain-containing protein [Alphaproteobacteria bacterium]|nr:WxcM-like domain-containing protein [Alphaproteobacteria bacterium]
MNYQLLDFPIHGDHNGNLIALEKGKDFPFDIRRVYYIWGTKSDIIRGKHAHKNLEQVIVCVSGSCDFVLNNGTVKETVHLDNPSKGLYVKHNIWREFTNFSKDCVLMVLASEYYSESDYIRNYDEFLKESRG